ncbi:hypothetical protein GXP71_15590 [Cellulomonas sp. H30R-01]|uniref:excalibur calcium-binding domain-containing protein n=1 Tax=Cellulomonas sp. H30R-01 TaxID=2704467 RepID=UPI00138B39C1|nr:excalibur calcium-binding domain-containing protein [Cellulomonas sp. H30R-01]QHT57355.1 hypothetical protein GXP71_15590 [Cellulomonas sp. H30R-01]
MKVFRAAPGWPIPPRAWRPPPGWEPDPSWPAAPDGWEFWVDEPRTGKRRGLVAGGVVAAFVVGLFAGISAASDADQERSERELSALVDRQAAQLESAEGALADAQARLEVAEAAATDAQAAVAALDADRTSLALQKEQLDARALELDTLAASLSAREVAVVQQEADATASSGQSSGTAAAPAATSYANCDAARAAGAAPVYAGEPGYGRHLDRDGDGIGCE